MSFGRLKSCPVVSSLVRRASGCYCHSLSGSFFSVREISDDKKQLFKRQSLYRPMAAGGDVNLPPKHQNRLAYEKSPYLLQHAGNPVDWYPWGEEAFEKAKKEDKLIFLSVGYSTCHWCHVMERESFENEETAEVMNEHFVNIKVDREERPDVDKMYMTFVQATSGGGGWPMSVWLTPELTPVYGGTYFPPADVYYGRPGFRTLLSIIATQWKDNRQKFSESGSKIIEVLQRTSVLDEASSGRNAEVPGEACWKKCMQQLSHSFEPEYGGFGKAPKFPQPVNLNFLFHVYSREPSSETGQRALDMCLHSLQMMAKGGIHDHVSQGFARYSTDDRWHVPHFEKMLYDQAQLVVAYSSAYVATKNPLYADIVRDILTYVDRDLSDKNGGFYSAEDADSYPTHGASHKKEGAFCVWTYNEVQSLLSKHVNGNDDHSLATVFCTHFNVKPEGNVNPLQDPHNELKNQNVLIATGTEEQTGEKLELDVATVQAALKEGREILYEARQKRPRPHLDDKMLTAWNGLMITGFAKAGQALESKEYVQRAVTAANFVKKHLYNPTAETLLRSCYKGTDGNIAQISSPIPGFLDDYAFLVRGLLDLYESCFDPSWLEWAEVLQEQQDRLFWDEEGAGYFTSPGSDPRILIRLKEDQDGAEPSGNSVAASNLLRLYSFLDRPELRDRAARLFTAFRTRLTGVPIALPEMTSALMCYYDSPIQVFVAGPPDSQDTKDLLEVVYGRLIPGRVLALADGRDDSVLYRRCEVIRRMKPLGGRAAAYVCRHQACSVPVASPQELARLLEELD
ncbi:Spermatogenesis-associated protein 20 [Cryptotermes secundus]|uniref:Spermatogenesis-associated protein 20 n=1 Tax=Cryptotermes secundus TaxID=105785 RepID=A0A2J7RRZ6_9NEOP|nr:spermatogenesis-associated protein 20 [Cryptotermes secundus]PNF43606.1 Spermatogenesis-associated protein 20 [Cryptotermes secundus]